MKPVRIGCAGWAYEDWRGVLYPPGMPHLPDLIRQLTSD
jgi:uncharacterized protein YecE (DUF72 family)